MGQGGLKYSATMKNAPTMWLNEEYASNMEQHVQLVAMKDVPVMYREEESASDMEQRVLLVAMNNVPAMYRDEESAGVTERRSIPRPGCTKRVVSVNE